MELTVHIFQTLDGVMQGPGSPEEDTRGGFTAGGWLVPLADADFGGIVDSWFQRSEAFLFGRTTWEAMQGFWPQVDDPANQVATKLNTLPKYLLTSRELDREWSGTTVLDAGVSDTGEAQSRSLDAVRELKGRPGGELQVHGCAHLVHSLHRAGLVDEFRLITFPVTVGGGIRTFPQDGPPTGFSLVDEQRTGSGARYIAMRPEPFMRGGFAVVDGKDTAVPAS